MTDPWTALMWGGLALVGIAGTVIGIALWLETPDVVPFGDLTWTDDGGDACDCVACTGAPTEAPGVLTIHAATDAEAAETLVRHV